MILRTILAVNSIRKRTYGNLHSKTQEIFILKILKKNTPINDMLN